MKTLGEGPATATGTAEADNRQLLVELGTARIMEQLRSRLETSVQKLQADDIDYSSKEEASTEVQELLFDQQHQIDLLLRGTSSMRGTMDTLKCSSREMECKNRKLQEELDKQHGAALKEMEAKLETAIKQVQQLQQSTRDRQQQQEATAQHSLQAASKDAAQLRGKVEELQQLKQVQAERQSLEAQVASLTQQQQDMSLQQEGLQEQLLAAAQGHSQLQVQYQQLEECKLKLQVQCQKAEAQLATATAAAQEQQAVAASSQQQLGRQVMAAQQQSQELQQQVQQLLDKKDDLEGQLQQADKHFNDVKTQLQASAKQYQEAAAQLAAQELDSQKLQWKITALQNEHQKLLRSTAEQTKQLQDAASQAQAALATIQAEADQRIAAAEGAAQAQVLNYKQKWREEFDKRRKLHNWVTELKGNIRVLARIRPMSEKEHSSSGSDAAVRALDEETVCVAGATAREYEFDRVFGPKDGQAQVFDEVSGLVTSILDGYNVCIMAYGQTGSGKTHTIEGPAEDPSVNSRALAELFRSAEERSTGFKYAFSASVLEIYNEQIFDLLAGSRDSGDKLDIKEGPQGLFIPGLRVEAVGGAEDVVAVLQKGKQHRSTFATNMNEHSSRSHLVLTIYVKGYDNAKGTSWSCKMHLIDLAGSERVSRSGAEGERLKEAAAINKSLWALGDVVAALQQRSSHVPYRNSKLTRLLEDSLGGSSKTLLVVNCSPAAENANESKCSLEFAARARKVELGSKVEQWLRTPFDVASFGPRATLGALLSMPEKLQSLQMDMERVTQLVQDPRPVEEKQQLVLQEVEDQLVTFLERGATIESDILASLKVLLPPDVTKQLDDLIPPPPNSQPVIVQEFEVEEPTVIYTADAVLESQIASEMTEIKHAVEGVRAALEELRGNSDTARAGMLRLNLKEARDILARRLQETAPGSAPAGTSSDASLSAAAREATVLLDEVDAQFFQ
ncbi:P-loop containing nucleoside triphosphate hydrolase protein [Scenedesmus sp. NREL 46B-D3]|nr:P-loop containing nucleoside triphosphate hydrolase protein [Scenedesmus sp. NREL 46B-D3]